MKDYSAQSFSFSGKKYTFTLTLYSLDDEIKVVLDNSALGCFEYESSANELVQRGTITYTDSQGKVDKLIEKPGSYCDVLFVENEQKYDGQMLIENYSDTNRLKTTFLIENIGIVNRTSNQIDYRISLVSSNIYSCAKTVDYTNYGADKEDVFQILQAYYKQAGMQVDDTFATVRSGVQLNYITGGNDNSFTATRYLMNKLYYYANKDVSLKFVFWNETNQRMQLFDIANTNTSTGIYTVVLSLLKTQHEGLMEQEQAKLATVTKMPVSEQIISMFGIRAADYDYVTNSIVRVDVSSGQIANYFNRAYRTDDGMLAKAANVSNAQGCFVRGSFWNNSFDTYGEMMKVLTKNNALLIETSGEILRKPGAMVDVNIDRDTREMPDENKQTLEDLMTRYRGLEGVYFTTKVHHYVFPRENRYKQVLTLARNFTVDMENKNSRLRGKSKT